MPYPILEIRHALVVAAILVVFWLAGRRAGFQRQRGWPVVLSGLGLVLFAAVVDAADVIGLSGSPGARLLTGLAYLPGLLLVGAGLLMWLPSLTRAQLDHAALTRSHARLRTRLAESNAELAAANEQLGREIGERRRVEETLSATVEESRRHEKEVSALLLAACGVLEHKSFTHNARALLEACRNLTGATAGYVALPVPGQPRLSVLLLDSGSGPVPGDGLPLLALEGLRGDVYRSGKMAYDNLAGDGAEPMVPGVPLTVENVLLAPVLIKGNVTGLLCIANKPGGFGPNDASLAEAFADLAALGLYNRQLEALVRSREQCLRTTGGAGTATPLPQQEPVAPAEP